MIRTTLMASAASLVASGAFAGGLDRTGQPLDIIFAEGNYAQLNFAFSKPSLSGSGVGIGALPAGTPYADVAGAFTTTTGGVKFDVTDKVSMSLIWDTPFGADVTYPGSPLTTELGGTSAVANANTLTAIGRYKFNDRFSVHAGVRQQTITGNITLSGLAYGGLPGPGSLNTYNVALGTDSALGYVVGAAYEIPQYAARVALTYNSAITHSMPTSETVAGLAAFGASPNTEVKSPESINLDFQTGVNQKTLVFGSVRYAKWSDLKISPSGFDAAVNPGTTGDSISDLDDSFEYELGVARRINENWAVSAFAGIEPEGSSNLVSPLAPSNGAKWVGLGARFEDEAVVLTGGVRYTMVGDAMPETGTPDTARANFSDNSALSLSLTLGFKF